MVGMVTSYNDVEGIRASTLKKFTVLPGERLSLRKAVKEKDLGRAGDLGSSVHYGLESQGEMHPDVVELPFDSLRTKAAKEWREYEESKGRIVLSQADYAKCQSMVEQVWSNSPPILKDMVQDSTAFREQVLTGGGLKAQIDLRVGGVVTDYKSTRHSDVRGIFRDFWRLAYDVQAAHYIQVLKLNDVEVDDFYFAFVSSEDPHETFMIRVTKSVLEFGHRRWEKALSTYLQWKDTPIEKLPPMYEDVIDIELPSWLSDEDDPELAFMD